MNYLKKIKQQKIKSKLPVLLIYGMNNYFNLITNREMTAGQFYLFICDFFDVINTWLKDQYSINHFLNDEINIQKNASLSKTEKDLYYTFLTKDGKHNPINEMIVLGLIPYLKNEGFENGKLISEFHICTKEINDYLRRECNFSGITIKNDLQNEILENEFNIVKEVA